MDIHIKNTSTRTNAENKTIFTLTFSRITSGPATPETVLYSEK